MIRRGGSVGGEVSCGPSSSQGSAFCADDTLVAVVPRFDMDRAVRLFSMGVVEPPKPSGGGTLRESTVVEVPEPSEGDIANESTKAGEENTDKDAVKNKKKNKKSSSAQKERSVDWGPVRAGIETRVPLWLAVSLHERSLACVSMPAWMDANDLIQVLRDEKRFAALVDDPNRLPFHYYEIGKRLAKLCASAWNVPQVPLLLEDIFQVRIDKLRQQFLDMMKEHSGSVARLRNTAGDEGSDTSEASGSNLLVKVNGIAAQELALLGPFVASALTDVQFFLQSPAEPGKESKSLGRNRDRMSKAAGRDYTADNADDRPASTGPSAEDENGANTSRAPGGSSSIRRRLHLRQFR
jgi:hypothetical protein